jgi:rhodanese-related sulfurtransferase
MRNLLLVSLLAGAAMTGCSKKDDRQATEATEAASNVPTVTVDELEAALANHACEPVDANGERTRKKLGVIPGAHLLSDSETFAISELPADKNKPLVFYCANKNCGSSHEAAAKAITAGYTNVKVMPAGIAGWVKAGKKTTSI